MKTLGEMIDYAKNIINSDREVRLAFFVKSLKDIPDSVVCKKPSYTLYSADNRSYLRFFVLPTTKTELECLSGVAFTHVFVAPSIYPSNDVYCFLKGKIRSSFTFKEPQGFYREFGVERWESY